MTEFGRLLRELRLAAGLSQQTLAERASMSANGVSALERGANRAPQRETLALLTRALSLSPEQADKLARAAERPSLPRSRENRRNDGMLPRAATPFFGRGADLDAVTRL